MKISKVLFLEILKVCNLNGLFSSSKYESINAVPLRFTPEQLVIKRGSDTKQFLVHCNVPASSFVDYEPIGDVLLNLKEITDVVNSIDSELVQLSLIENKFLISSPDLKVELPVDSPLLIRKLREGEIPSFVEEKVLTLTTPMIKDILSSGTLVKKLPKGEEGNFAYKVVIKGKELSIQIGKKSTIATRTYQFPEWDDTYTKTMFIDSFFEQVLQLLPELRLIIPHNLGALFLVEKKELYNFSIAFSLLNVGKVGAW